MEKYTESIYTAIQKLSKIIAHMSIDAKECQKFNSLNYILLNNNLQNNKEEDKMEKYKFHVGDYVETVDGKVGYIESITNSKYMDTFWVNFKFNNHPEMFTNSSLLSTGYNPCVMVPLSSGGVRRDMFFEHFNQIGKYDFTKPEKKNKIEPIEYTNLGHGGLIVPQGLDICKKLNEVIAYINKQEG